MQLFVSLLAATVKSKHRYSNFFFFYYTGIRTHVPTSEGFEVTTGTTGMRNQNV